MWAYQPPRGRYTRCALMSPCSVIPHARASSRHVCPYFARARLTVIRSTLTRAAI